MALVDWMTGVELSVSIFYLIPIILAVWFSGKLFGILTSVAASVFWFFLDRQDYSYPFTPYWNAFVRLGFFLVTAFLVEHIRFLTSNLELLLQKRTAELVAEGAERRRVEREVAEISRQEQQQLAHELHDRFGGYLAGIAFRGKALAESLQRHGAPQTGEARQLVELISDGANQARNFSRLLMPLEASDEGLGPGLHRLGTDIQALFGVECAVEVSPNLPSFTNDQGLQLYRIAQEAARNAVQHGNASLVEISVRREEDQLKLTVRNDGGAWAPSGEPTRSLGLRIMRYRAGMLGGTLSVQSEVTGCTTIECSMPLQEMLT